MAGFKGRAEYSVDNKGRVAIPAKMRSALNPEAQNAFVITRGLDTCIFLYPADRWREIEVEIRNLNVFDSDNRGFIRGVLMWADDVVLDGQGRIGIPKELMQYAGITDRVLILGALDHIEIWEPDKFEAYLNTRAADYEALAERVMVGRDG